MPSPKMVWEGKKYKLVAFVSCKLCAFGNAPLTGCLKRADMGLSCYGGHWVRDRQIRDKLKAFCKHYILDPNPVGEDHSKNRG